MKALLIAAVAVMGLGSLAGCGERESAVTSVGSSSATADPSDPSKPEPPSVVAEPTPPAGKPMDPGATSTPPVTIGPNGPVVPDGVTEVPAARIDASAVPAYYEQLGRVWVFDDGFSLQLFAAASSGCTDAEAVVVDQAADTVKVVLRPLDGPQGGRPDDEMCTAVMAPKPVVVRLDTPLGDRTVVLSAAR